MSGIETDGRTATVRRAIIDGQPWSVYTVHVVSVDGDTLTYTTDGVWTSTAVRNEYSDWTLHETPRIVRELRAESVNPARPYSVTDADTGETLASGVTYSRALNVVYARHGRYRVTSLIGGASELFDYSGED